MHIRCIDVLDPVKTILSIIRASYIDTIVLIKDCQRSADCFGFTDFNRRSVAERSMLQHLFALIICSKLEDIELIVLTVCTPVVLRGLERIIHLIDPGADKSRLLCNCCDYAATSVIAACERTVLRCQVLCVSLQHRERDKVLNVVNICNVPGEAYAVAMRFALGNICRPFLCESFRIDEVLCVKLMEPLDTILVALLCSCADDLKIISYRNVSALVHIADAFAEAVDKDCRILVAVIYDAGHRNDGTFDTELFLKISSAIAESNQSLLELINCAGHRKAEEIQPLLVDERHVADCLDSCLLGAELLDPRERPDMSVRIRRHDPVFRILVKYCLKVRHISINVLFKRNDNSLIRIFQQVCVTESGSENEFSQSLRVSHCEGNLIAPLVTLDCVPLYMDIGLLLKTFKDRTVIGVGLCVGRIADQTLDCCGLRKRELKALSVDFLHFACVEVGSAATAGSYRKSHARREDHSHCLFK